MLLISLSRSELIPPTVPKHPMLAPNVNRMCEHAGMFWIASVTWHTIVLIWPSLNTGVWKWKWKWSNAAVVECFVISCSLVHLSDSMGIPRWMSVTCFFDFLVKADSVKFSKYYDVCHCVVCNDSIKWNFQCSMHFSDSLPICLLSLLLSVCHRDVLPVLCLIASL